MIVKISTIYNKRKSYATKNYTKINKSVVNVVT